MSAVNEALIRDVVAEVLGRLGKPVQPAPVVTQPHCACNNGHASGSAGGCWAAAAAVTTRVMKKAARVMVASLIAS